MTVTVFLHVDRKMLVSSISGHCAPSQSSFFHEHRFRRSDSRYRIRRKRPATLPFPFPRSPPNFRMRGLTLRLSLLRRPALFHRNHKGELTSYMLLHSVLSSCRDLSLKLSFFCRYLYLHPVRSLRRPGFKLTLIGLPSHPSCGHHTLKISLSPHAGTPFALFLTASPATS